MLNGASAGFSLERGWHWLERVQERRRKKKEGEITGGWEGMAAGKAVESLSSFQGYVASYPPVKLH